MTRLQVSLIALSAAASMSMAPAFAAAPAPARPAAAAKPAPAGKPVMRKTACCRAPAGTVVMVEIADPLSTKTLKTGDKVALRLTEPLVISGRVLLKAGTPGEGVVIESAKPGLGGKSAKLVLAARSLGRGRAKVRLQAFQLNATGKNNSLEANAAGLTGIAFAPLGFAALAIRGGDVEMPAGAKATAKIARTLYLPSLGKAAPGTAESLISDTSETLDSAIELPTPPQGQGQVVFFRPKTVLGTAQWFNVREDSKVLGKLTNGAYFVMPLRPGVHTFTANVEPRFDDKLKIEVDAGETYFVEGGLTKGVFIGAANLTPSDRAAFAKASKGLKVADDATEEPKADSPKSDAPPADGAKSE